MNPKQPKATQSKPKVKPKQIKSKPNQSKPKQTKANPKGTSRESESSPAPHLAPGVGHTQVAVAAALDWTWVLDEVYYAGRRLLVDPATGLVYEEAR